MFKDDVEFEPSMMHVERLWGIILIFPYLILVPCHSYLQQSQCSHWKRKMVFICLKFCNEGVRVDGVVIACWMFLHLSPMPIIGKATPKYPFSWRTPHTHIIIHANHIRHHLPFIDFTYFHDKFLEKAMHAKRNGSRPALPSTLETIATIGWSMKPLLVLIAKVEWI